MGMYPLCKLTGDQYIQDHSRCSETNRVSISTLIPYPQCVYMGAKAMCIPYHPMQDSFPAVTTILHLHDISLDLNLFEHIWYRHSHLVQTLETHVQNLCELEAIYTWGSLNSYPSSRSEVLTREMRHRLDDIEGHLEYILAARFSFYYCD